MALTYNQVTAITHDLIKEKLTEGVFTSNAVLKRMRAKQVLEDGGNQIVCPLFSVDDTGSTGAFYDSRDNLSLAEYSGISASVHDWKQLYESVVIYKLDIAKNAGKAGAVKLISSKVKGAEMAMSQRMIKGIVSDGTNATGALDSDQFIGLAKIVKATDNYGGIAIADLATWLSYVDSNSGTPRSLTQAILDKALDQATEQGRGGPTLGIMEKGVFSKFKGLLTGQQRVTREDTVSGQGHKGQVIVYNGIDHMIENQVDSGELFYIDEESAKLHVHRDHNMRRQSISDLETADALLERIFCYAAFIASERKYHSKVEDITV